LFRGQTRTLDMHLAPEQIHFGFRHAKDRNGRPMLTKPLHAGSRRDVEALLSPVPMRAEPGKPARGGTVDVARLVDQLGDVLGLGPDPLDVADVAVEMVEGVPKVRFVLV
jgi:hypothetical protein